MVSQEEVKFEELPYDVQAFGDAYSKEELIAIQATMEQETTQLPDSSSFTRTLGRDGAKSQDK